MRKSMHEATSAFTVAGPSDQPDKKRNRENRLAVDYTPENADLIRRVSKQLSRREGTTMRTVLNRFTADCFPGWATKILNGHGYKRKVS